MEWFNTWWQEIGLTGQIMACAAIPATVVMLLQFFMMLLGGVGIGEDSDGSADIDGDADCDAEFDSGDVELDHSTCGCGFDHNAERSEAEDGAHSGVRIFTVRGVVAFFAIGGWAGLAAISAGLRVLWSVQIAFLAGAAAMIFAAMVIQLALKMQSSGNINPENAISHTATVYITIPPRRGDTGKVTMLLQERFVEMEAVTDSDAALRPNTMVEVVGLTEDKCLIVSPVLERELAPASPAGEDKDNI